MYHGNGFLVCTPADLIGNIRLEHQQLLEVVNISLSAIAMSHRGTDLWLLRCALGGVVDLVGLLVFNLRRLGSVRGDRRGPDEVAGADKARAPRQPLDAVGAKRLGIRGWGRPKQRHTVSDYGHQGWRTLSYPPPRWRRGAKMILTSREMEKRRTVGFQSTISTGLRGPWLRYGELAQSRGLPSGRHSS